MSRALVAVLVALAAAMPPARAGYEADGPMGYLCTATYESSSGTDRTVEVDAELVAVDLDGNVRSGTVDCTIQVYDAYPAGPDDARTSAYGTGAIVLPPTALGYAAETGAPTYLCTEFTYDDGTRLYWHDEDGSGHWSPDSWSPCQFLWYEPEPAPLAGPPCADGVDNDGDGAVDHPADSGCSSALDVTEEPDQPVDPAWLLGCDGRIGVEECTGVRPPGLPCADGVDNDGDGAVDHPADSGCSSVLDPTEQPEPSGPPRECSNDTGVEVCTVVTVGEPRDRTLVVGPRPGARIAGYVDRYLFTLPGGGTVAVPCVVLGDTNACAAAGGTFDGRVASLGEAEVPDPAAPLDHPAVTIRACDADLKVTVAGFGVESFPLLTPC